MKRPYKYLMQKSQPLEPYKPIPPVKSTTTVEHVAFDWFEQPKSLALVELPDGMHWSDVWVVPPDCDEYYGTTLCLRKETIIPNERYTQEFKTYEKHMREYEVKYAEYLKDLDTFNKREQLEQRRELNKRLNAAKKLLKEHGVLK